MSIELDNLARQTASVTRLYQVPRGQRVQDRIRQTVMDLSKEERTLWIRAARDVAVQIANEKGEVCADDLHERFPVPPGIDGRTMGKVFSFMQFVRFKRSARRECHYRTISVFRNPDP